ncbi:unnamed protein product, partial [Symbiodinium microadriaticum]
GILRSDTGISQSSDGTGPMEIEPLSKKFTFNGSPNDVRRLTEEEKAAIEALSGPEDIDLQERKRLNEGLRRRMNNPKGLKKGLVQQWNAATSPMEKLRPQMRLGIGYAFLLDKEMGSIQVDAYYEESFACI